MLEGEVPFLSDISDIAAPASAGGGGGAKGGVRGVRKGVRKGVRECESGLDV